MTAVTGANFRTGGEYWELSGPLPINRVGSCRACKGTIYKGEQVMVRDGRKLRFFYHDKCFTGGADPRTQDNSSYATQEAYHKPTAPNISSLEGPRACRDADGRTLGRQVFKQHAPCTVGHGKWSVGQRGYQPCHENLGITSKRHSKR